MKIYRIFVDNYDGDLVHGYYSTLEKALTELWRICDEKDTCNWEWNLHHNLLEEIEFD